MQVLIFILLVIAFFFGWTGVWITLGSVAAIFVLLLITGANSHEGSALRNPRAKRTSSQRIRVSANLHLAYEDADGQTTQRDVRVHAYDAKGGSIEGYCELRKANRTFRIDRIREAVDLGTGEIVTGLRSYLRKNRVS